MCGHWSSNVNKVLYFACNFTLGWQMEQTVPISNIFCFTLSVAETKKEKYQNFFIPLTLFRLQILLISKVFVFLQWTKSKTSELHNDINT